METGRAPCPLRCRPRFSLGTLLAAVVAAGALLGANLARERQDLVWPATETGAEWFAQYGWPCVIYTVADPALRFGVHEHWSWGLLAVDIGAAFLIVAAAGACVEWSIRRRIRADCETVRGHDRPGRRARRASLAVIAAVLILNVVPGRGLDCTLTYFMDDYGWPFTMGWVQVPWEANTVGWDAEWYPWALWVNLAVGTVLCVAGCLLARRVFTRAKCQERP